jgi:hypothetical protein
MVSLLQSLLGTKRGPVNAADTKVLGSVRSSSIRWRNTHIHRLGLTAGHDQLVPDVAAASFRRGLDHQDDRSRVVDASASGERVPQRDALSTIRSWLRWPARHVGKGSGPTTRLERLTSTCSATAVAKHFGQHSNAVIVNKYWVLVRQPAEPRLTATAK